MTARQPGDQAPPEPAQVVALADLVTRADGVAPLSEQFRLNLERAVGPSVRHVAAQNASGTLVGYAQVDLPGAGDAGSAELFVHPEHRRAGIGSWLLAQVGDVPIWAHGSTAPAVGFAATHDLAVVRELHKMHLRITASAPLPVSTPAEVALPPGFTLRTFDPAADADEWVRVNARAFAGHPEQGRLTIADLSARVAEPWFDPAGLLLIVPLESPALIAAYHWTKRDPGSAVGEVYVVGVDPAYQGLGLGRAVTLAGLAHLHHVGVDTVELYVDDSNTVAMHTYRSLGFTIAATDRMYRGQPHPASLRTGPRQLRQVVPR